MSRKTNSESLNGCLEFVVGVDDHVALGLEFLALLLFLIDQVEQSLFIRLLFLLRLPSFL